MKYYTHDKSAISVEKHSLFKNYVSEVYRMMSIDNEENAEKSVPRIATDTHHLRADAINKKDSILEMTVNFMSSDLPLNMKNNVINTEEKNQSISENYDNLSGAAFIQLCNIIVNRTAAKEDRLLTLYNAVNKFSNDKEFGCFKMNGGLLYLEYLFHKNVFNWFDISLFNQRLYSIINIIRKNAPSVDIINGMAGILVVCSRMFLLCPCKTYHSTIKFLSDSILKEAVFIDHQYVAWHKSRTGFAHGNSGIAYALLLANSIINNEEINEVVIKALKYEQLFKTANGWAGLDILKKDEDSNSWYHGATGIYMSRKAMLEENYFDSDEIPDILHADIAHYKETKKKRAINLRPSLCHGAYGNAIIDPQSYSSYLTIDHSIYTSAESKSLLHGRPGAVYANLFVTHGDRELPNLLLLK